MLDSDYKSRVMRLVKACAYQLKAVADPGEEPGVPAAPLLIFRPK